VNDTISAEEKAKIGIDVKTCVKFTALVCGQFAKIEKFPLYNNNRPDYSP